MQTRMTYNGVVIDDVLSDPISHEGIKDSTGVDQIGVRITVEFTGVVHTSTNSHTGVQIKSGATLAAGLDSLLDRLTKDRRPFKMEIGKGAVLYDVKPGAVEAGAGTVGVTVAAHLHEMDIDHGPKTSVQILKIVAGFSATIRMRVEFTVVNCGDSARQNGLSQSGLVNFRFWIADDVDCRTWLTTRTYSGRLRVAHKNISPHVLARTICVPPLQSGFQREVISLHENQNGLELDFTVRDREFIVAPPWSANSGKGACDWSGTFRISTSDYAQSFSELNFSLTGPKGTSKRDLGLLGMKIVSSKTHYLALAGRDGQAFLEQFSISEELDQNRLEFVCRLRHTGNFQQFIGLFGIGGKFEVGAPLGDMGIRYPAQVAMNPGPSAGLAGIFLSLLQTPCNPQQMPAVYTSQKSQPYKSQRGSGSAADDEETYDISSPAPTSPSHLQGMYLDYSIDSDLCLDAGVIGLPTGASSKPNSATMAFVQLYQPTAYRDIAIRASRVNKPPELPAPNQSFSDANGILATMVGQAHVKSSVPQLSADQRKLLYLAEMEIRYGLSRPPRAGESVPVGALPYRVTGFSDPSRRLPPEVFVKPQSLLT